MNSSSSMRQREAQASPRQKSSGEETSWDGLSTTSTHLNDEEQAVVRPTDQRMVSFGADSSSSPPNPNEDLDIPDTVVVNPGKLCGMVFGCAKWSKQRLQTTAVGIISSIIVLTVRLHLDREPLAYLIHSIVVFLDMALIHLFTNSIWLSVSGECVTIAMAIGFHFSKETVWELLETTLLAVLCSFHLINSRHKHMESEKGLRQDLKDVCNHTTDYLTMSIRALEIEKDNSSEENDDEGSGIIIANKNSDESLRHRSTSLHRQASRRVLEKVRSTMINWESDRSVEYDPEHNDHIEDLEHKLSLYSTFSKHKQCAKVWGEQFFEHFLDGSAGVMYTSFFGLILDELIRMRVDDDKCK